MESQETVVRAKQIKIQELSEAKGLVSGQITWPLLSSIYNLSSGKAWTVKESVYNPGDVGSIPGLGRSTTPVFLPGESPWIAEPGGLHFMRSQRVGHDWATKHSTCQAQQLGESALAAGSLSVQFHFPSSSLPADHVVRVSLISILSPVWGHDLQDVRPVGSWCHTP